jgi:predicted lipoprotein with Yx(FWY)xxD motif
MKTFSAFAAASIMTVLVGCAGMASAQAPAKTTDGVLTNSAGMTLYTFDKDPAGAGKSTCNGPCATNWPPLLAQDGASASDHYSIVTRDDGKKQWAYMGKPLYLWSKDQKPGDKTGDGFKDVWHVAKP